MNDVEAEIVTEVELEIGTIDNQVVFHVKCPLPVTEPILLGFKVDKIDAIIETLQDAKQRVLNYETDLIG